MAVDLVCWYFARLPDLLWADSEVGSLRVPFRVVFVIVVRFD